VVPVKAPSPICLPTTLSVSAFDQMRKISSEMERHQCNFKLKKFFESAKSQTGFLNIIESAKVLYKVS